MVCFQSRFGSEEWLQPYLDQTMEELPGRGIKRIAVVSPAFVTDCLETLEEIQVENREIFEHAGGEQFTYIPCLNDDEAHIAFLEELALERAAGLAVDWRDDPIAVGRGAGPGRQRLGLAEHGAVVQRLPDHRVPAARLGPAAAGAWSGSRGAAMFILLLASLAARRRELCTAPLRDVFLLGGVRRRGVRACWSFWARPEPTP